MMTPMGNLAIATLLVAAAKEERIAAGLEPRTELTQRLFSGRGELPTTLRLGQVLMLMLFCDQRARR